MYIRTQDRRSLINLDNIIEICIAYNNSTYSIRAYTTADHGEYPKLLGLYETEERALEVLDTIVERMCNIRIADSELSIETKIKVISNENKYDKKSCIVFDMPKE